MRARTVRRSAIGMVVVALMLVAPVPVSAEPTVYEFFLNYSGSCEGFTNGELRVDGAIVELWGDDGGSLQKVGSGRREPDDAFNLSVPEAGFTMTGKLNGDSVSGTGQYSALGDSCPFSFEGRLVGGAPDTLEVPAPPPDSEPEEFDPTSEAPLSVGEVRTILDRLGLSKAKIDEFLVTPLKTPGGPGFVNAVVARLIRSETDDGQPSFPVLSALAQGPAECADEDDPRCASPYASILRGTIFEPERGAVFYRMVRLAINMDLPAERDGDAE